MGAKVIYKFTLDTEDPDTIRYERIYEYAKKSMASERAV
jgi:hypothetical protein